MAYIRGKDYIWSDGQHMHFWVRSPDDDISDYVHDCDFAAGVCMPLDIIDAFVAMRWARMVEDGTAAAAVTLALTTHRNFGADALQRAHGLPNAGAAALLTGEEPST